MDSSRIQKIRKLVIVLIAVALLTACTPTRPGPRAWIDSPFDGAVLPAGETVAVTGHTSSMEGTQRVFLVVDGRPEMNMAPDDTAADFIRVDFPWTPPGEGDYTLQLRMTDGAEETGVSEVVRVRVGSVALAVEPAVEEPPVEEPAEPPDTEEPPTEQPPTPTETVYVPPTDTPEPQDTTPPPVPTPMVPADGLVFGCASTQNLVWLPVEDESGLNGYYVRLERENSPGSWERINDYGPINDKQYEVSIDCGVAFRWSVRAEDNAGNKSSWSAWSTFAVELD